MDTKTCPTCGRKMAEGQHQIKGLRWDGAEEVFCRRSN